MADGKVRVVGVRCEESTPIVNTPLRQLTSLFTDLAIVIVGILRNERAIVPKPEDQMLPGDEVYFVCRSEEHTSELQSLMRISYAVFCLKKTKTPSNNKQSQTK